MTNYLKRLISVFACLMLVTNMLKAEVNEKTICYSRTPNMDGC